jgi:dihydroorotase
LSLLDELLTSFDPIFKVNPPLRTAADIAALKAGVLDGTIDAIATDHAPHAGHTKEQPLDQAPPGMLGLETALAVVNTSMDLDARKIVELMSWNPARIAGLDARHGRTADVWEVSREGLASKSKNTPYHGMNVRGRVRHTLFNGQIVVNEGKATR